MKYEKEDYNNWIMILFTNIEKNTTKLIFELEKISEDVLDACGWWFMNHGFVH